MRSVAILGVAAACFSKPPPPGGDSDAKQPGDGPTAEGWLDGFEFRKRVTVTSGVTGTLANFPVGVARTDAEIAEHARDDGKDLVATADDGVTLLATDLAAYNAGAFELWVRMPELAATGAFYLYYGGASQERSTAVWDGPVFAGVWHLSEIGTAIDSTGQQNHLTASAAATPTSVPDGTFGPARELDGNDSLDGGDPADDSLDFGDDSFSYSLWVNQSAPLGQFDTPFYKGGPSGAEPGYCLILGTGTWAAKITDIDDDFIDADFGLQTGFQGRWTHLVAVIDRASGTIKAYADGDERASRLLADRNIGSLTTPQPIQLSRGVQTAYAGKLDEVRVYKTALDVAWIETEHRNGTDPDFVTLGDEEKKP